MDRYAQGTGLVPNPSKCALEEMRFGGCRQADGKPGLTLGRAEAQLPASVGIQV